MPKVKIAKPLNVLIIVTSDFSVIGLGIWFFVHQSTPVDKARQGVVSVFATDPIAKTITKSSPLMSHIAAQKNMLVVEFDQSTDLAAFYQRYKKSTNPIERYMAFKAFNDCQNDVGILKEIKGINSASTYAEVTLARSKNPNFNREHRLKLAQNTWERCASFNRTPASIKEANAIANALGRQGELPLGVSVFLEKNKDNPLVINQLLEATAKLDNGYAWLEILPMLSAYSDQLLIDGKPINNEEIKELSNALAMAACDLGQVCNDGSRVAAMYCVEFGECGDVAYAIQQHVLTPVENQRAMELRDKIINAIRQRNQSFFTLRPASKKSE
ncbi:MAG: hypothetical protein HC782_05340 [Gammaproteobacteria bacterium]|nr:hypothetical protein [Gammaproteobacteria bacterium]